MKKKMSELEWYEWWLSLGNNSRERTVIVEMLIDAGLERHKAIKVTYAITRLIEVHSAYKN